MHSGIRFNLHNLIIMSIRSNRISTYTNHVTWRGGASFTDEERGERSDRPAVAALKSCHR